MTAREGTMRYSVRWLHGLGLDPRGALLRPENRSLAASVALDRSGLRFEVEASK
jgi:hypothetical protein